MDAEFLGQLLPALNKGLGITISLIVPSAILGLLLGTIIGSIRAFAPAWLRLPANAYTTLFRGVPLVVQLTILYFGLPGIGIVLEPYTAAVLGFILCSAAYQSEYIRGALISINQGQIKAARALGFGPVSSIVHIVLPQAIRRALPGCGNEIIYLIKYSSLAYIVTCIELTGEGKIVASRTLRYSEVFFVVGIYYLGLVSLASFILHRVEKYLRIPGQTPDSPRPKRLLPVKDKVKA